MQVVISVIIVAIVLYIIKSSVEKSTHDEIIRTSKERQQQWRGAQKSIGTWYEGECARLYKFYDADTLPNVLNFSNVGQAVVMCSNTHIYRFVDFLYSPGTITTTEQHTTQHTETLHTTTNDTTEVYTNRPKSLNDLISPVTVLQGQHTTTSEVVVPVTNTVTSSRILYDYGCPACHSTLFHFEDPALENKFPQYARHFCPCFKYDYHKWGKVFFLKNNVECPFCSLRKQYDERVEAAKTLIFG